MKGMIGLGLGIGLAIAATGSQGHPPVGLIYGVLAAFGLLMYLWGRSRRSRGATATAVASATAAAEANSTATSAPVQNVQVYVGGGPRDDRLDQLHGVTWRADIQRDPVQEIEHEERAELVETDGVDQVLDDLRRGIPAPPVSTGT